MKRLILVFATLLIISIVLPLSLARADEGHHSFGAEAGEVGLSGDVGNSYGSGLGVGAFFNYAASDYLELELEWLNSHHSSNTTSGQSLNQNVYGVSILWDLDQLDIFTPYLRGGTEVVMHNQDITDPNTGKAGNYNTNAFGLVAGAGAKFDVSKNLMAAIDFSYHGIFDASQTTPSGAPVKAIQSYFTVLLRLGFAFGGQ